MQTSELVFFTMQDYWWVYAGFLAFVGGMLALDLGVFHKHPHEVSVKESLAWTVCWITLALICNYCFYIYADFTLTRPPYNEVLQGQGGAWAKQLALEFLSGFVIEKALAIDNIFVFIVIFKFLAIPKHLQHRVLFFGVLGALMFRALFIALGSVLLQFHGIMIVAGVLLIFTGFKVLFTSEKEPDPSKHPLLKILKKHLPLTDRLHAQRFFIKEHGRRMVTPLFLALLLIECSDIVFALDSVPAIFAITKEPMIVFMSNIFAIMGLRSLYFIFSNSMNKLRYMSHGLGIILVFVGLKMAWLDAQFNGKFPITWSLGFIGGVLGWTVLASLLGKRKHIR